MIIKRTIRVAIIVWLISATAAVSASTRVAILADTRDKGNEHIEIFSDLLGIQLQADKGLTLLERDQYEAVLDEINISQLIGADAVSSRLEASRLLGADALVMIHKPGEDGVGVFITVVDTRYGLRLGSLSLQIEDDVEAVAKSAASATRGLLVRASEPIKAAVAVPAFVDARLDPTPERLGVQIAESLRVVLGELPGVLILEVDEARALAREMNLRGDDRLKALPDPLFLTGRLTTSADGSCEVSLKADRDSHEPQTRTFNAESLHDIVSGSIKTGHELTTATVNGGLALKPGSPSGSVDRLRKAAVELNTMGDPDQARDLVETAILLNPDSPILRDLAIQTIKQQCWKRLYRNYNSNHKHVDTGFVLRVMQASLDHRYTGVVRILRDGDYELKSSRGNPVLIDSAVDSIYDYLRSGEQRIDEDIYRQMNDMLGRHYLDLYGLVMGTDDEGLGPFNAGYLTGLFRIARQMDPNHSLTFEQRAAVFERFQDRPDADYVMKTLFRCKDLKYFSKQLRLMDQRLDGLSLQGFFAYELGRNSEVEMMYGYVRQGTTHRTAKVENLLKEYSLEQEKKAADALALRLNDPMAVNAGHIELRVNHGPGSGEDRLILPEGWSDAGDYGELIYDAWNVYLITGRDKVRRLYSLDPTMRKAPDSDRTIHISKPCFDGQNVWVTIPTDPGRLVVIDLDTFKVSDYSGGDGVPPMAGGCAVAPLGRGETLVVGATSWDFLQIKHWFARARLRDDGSISIQIINQIMPEDDMADYLSRGIDKAVTLTDPEDESHQVVLIDNDDLPDTGDVFLVSPEDGKVTVLKSAGLGLSHCFVYNGSIYSADSLSYERRYLGPVHRYELTTGRVTPVRPHLVGQSVTGMAHHDGGFFAIDHDGNLWGSRDLTDIARKMGPVVPDRSGIDPDTFDPWQPGELWMRFDHPREFAYASLHSSRFYGLVALCRTYADEEPEKVKVPWAIDVDPRHLAAIDQPPAIPTLATRIGDRFVFNALGNWSYPEALRLADAYGASLLTIEDRASYDALKPLARGRKNKGHHWTRLGRKGDRLFLIGDVPRDVTIEGIPIGGAKEGYVLARWDPPTITGAGEHIRMKVLLEWPADDLPQVEPRPTATGQPSPAWLPMIELPAGRSVLGNHDPDSPFARIEPQREITIPAGIWMGATEVTYAQFRHVIEDGPVPDRTPSAPAPYDPRFIIKLNRMTGLNYRLPTEAEWEYACRAGSTTRYSSGDSTDDLRRVGWCSYNGVIGSAAGTTFTRSFEPNAWGFYDMHGNLAEATCSLLDADNSTVRNIHQVITSNRRMIIRGGSWMDGPERCRSSYRRIGPLNGRNVGFRLVLDLNQSDNKDESR